MDLQRDGSLYQRLSRAMCDVAVALLNIRCPKLARSKPDAPVKRLAPLAESTEARLRAAWTQGDLDAPKLVQGFAPQHVPVPESSLAEWTARLAEIESRERSSSPQCFKSFASIERDALSDIDATSPFHNGFPDDILAAAATEDAGMTKMMMDEIEAHTPNVQNIENPLTEVHFEGCAGKLHLLGLALSSQNH